uniref:FACT complex subunit n=1 Tax=Trichuris muris TaxID=70415 RepID=A0A5S6QLI1_TRIMR
MAPAGLQLDAKRFWVRLSRIYSFWDDGRHSPLSDISVMFSCMGSTRRVAYCKTLALQTWLLGYEIPDMLLIVAKNCVIFFCGERKIDLFRQVEKSPNALSTVDLKFICRSKEEKLDAQLVPVLNELEKLSQNGSVGTFAKERPSGEFADAWNEIFSKSKMNVVDVTVPFALLMAVKDQSEVALIKTACESTCTFFNKFLKPQLIGLVEEEKVVTHAAISEACSKAARSSKYLSDVDLSKLDLCYPPIIQSGGRYALKYGVISDDNNLNYGAIVCSLGLRYKQYCSNISRTLLIDPSQQLQEIYALLCSVQQKVIESLKPKVRLSAVYEAAQQLVKESNPDLLPSLTKNVGFGIGIEFRESTLLINANNAVQAEEGMVFNISVGFADVPNVAGTENIGKTISLFIADTVLVDKDGGRSFTDLAKKRFKNISMFTEEEEDEPEQNKENIDDALGRGKRSVVLQEQLRSKENKDEQRKQHQKELIEQLNVKARERLAQAKNAKSKQRIRKAAVSYKSIAHMPREKEVSRMQFYVDEKRDSVIMPLAGSAVPVHISMIKNISMSNEGDFTYLRINLFHPGMAVVKDASSFPAPDAIYVKEMTFRSTNVKEPGELHPPSLNLIMASTLIKDLQKSYRAKEAEEREKEGIVQQDTLIVNSSQTFPRLKDLYVRPNMINKRLIGTLEAHTNGFRYVASRGDRLDILYRNIKHAFFQPCDGEMIVLIHFHLKDAILYGKRKHSDIQFFTEVGEITTDLGKRGGREDRDDLYAEQAERDLRRKLNIAFKSFCDRVESLTNQLVEFDTPFRSLGFYGVPFRSSVLLQPTSCCLVNLSDWPPLVITLDEVELVHFERVQFHLKNFDMVFIFKDYTQKPFSITAIPTDVLDHVKDWLNSCDIPFSEGIQSLNWPKIMKSILDDAEGFFDSGGWDFLTKDEDDTDEEGETVVSNDDDEDFTLEEEEESSEEDSDEDYESVASSESAGSGGSESGMSWSELEEETRMEEK